MLPQLVFSRCGITMFSWGLEDSAFNVMIASTRHMMVPPHSPHMPHRHKPPPRQAMRDSPVILPIVSN
jgi:hypothetical protein